MVNDTTYDQFRIDADTAQDFYPLLKLIDTGIPELSGTIVLKDNWGQELDQYKLRILATPGYPYLFPYVFEIGGKIPVNADWHVYESDGHLCLCTTTNEFIKTMNGLSLKDFIKNELEPYLFNQTYRRKEGFFLNEMPHGDAGQLVSLKNYFKTNDIGKIKQFLLMAKADYKMGRTDFCFCGSGIKYRHCHREIFKTFKDLGEIKLNVLLNIVENTNEYRLSLFR